MASIRPATGPIPKPKRLTKPVAGLRRGGKKPKEAGRRYEHSFGKKYGFQRQVGSGAFAKENPMLAADLVGEIGRLKLAFENKSWEQYNGKGEKTVSFPVALLDKIAKEAELLAREPIFIYHVKGASTEWAVVNYEWLHNLITQWENDILALMEEASGN